MPTFSVLLDPFCSIMDNVISDFATTMEFYAEGTSTLQDVFSDNTGGTALANPFTISAGRATIYGTDALGYKVILKNSAGVTLTTIDNYFTNNTLTNVSLLTSTDASALVGPTFELYRNSASPADDDLIGSILFTGQDDGANKTTYGEIIAKIQDVTGGTEDGEIIMRAMVAGTLTDIVKVRSYVQIDKDVFLNQGSEPWLYFERQDVTPNDNDDIGTLFFRGNNSASTLTNYAYITARMLDVTAATEDGEIQFHTRGAGSMSKALTIDQNNDCIHVGTSTYAAGEGCVFNGDAIAAANTLDDYEEGTWTPVLSDGANNATTSTQVGSYTKVGRQVHIKGYIVLSSLGSVSGSVRIAGLPFVSNSAANDYASGVFGYGLGLAIPVGTNLTGRINPNASYMIIFNWDVTGGTSNAQGGEITASGALMFEATYYV